MSQPRISLLPTGVGEVVVLHYCYLFWVISFKRKPIALSVIVYCILILMIRRRFFVYALGPRQCTF